MRLTQVARQSFVGIDLLGQELGPAPLPPAVPVISSGRFFSRYVWALFDNVHHLELGLRFHDILVDSQIATDVAVRELVVLIFNDVPHFSIANSCIYKGHAKMNLRLKLSKGRPQRSDITQTLTDFLLSWLPG